MSKIRGKSHSVDLENLPVYGDLLKLYRLPAHGTIMEAGKLYEELHALEHRMLTLYASYVLAQNGFNVEMWIGEDIMGVTGEAIYTTTYKDADWVKDWHLFEPMEEGTLYLDWEVYYKNEQQNRLKIIFVTMFLQSSHFGKDGKLHTLDVAESLFEKCDGTCSSYILVHPKLARQHKKAFVEAKEKMKEIAGQDLLLSTGEFTVKFIPEKEKRQIIEENWRSLRAKIIENLQKKWPILIFATRAQQILDVDERIRKSRIKYNIHSFEDAIKDAGVACESLLQILYAIHISKGPAEELEFYELLCASRDFLSEEFGALMYQDLDFIRIWRNNVVHPRRKKPDAAITLQVIAKAELFNELFKKKIYEQNLWSQ